MLTITNAAQLREIAAGGFLTTKIKLRPAASKKLLRQFVAALPQCRRLTHLDLSDNWIGAAGAQVLAAAFPQYSWLTYFDLHHNLIGDAGAQELATVLPRCPRLTHLDLGWNSIGAAGAQALAGVLPRCRQLRHLDLGCNRVDDAGAQVLAVVLQQCHWLTYLDLSSNEITDAEVDNVVKLQLARNRARLRLDALRRRHAAPTEPLADWWSRNAPLFLD
jgi:hypothetical protein